MFKKVKVVMVILGMIMIAGGIACMASPVDSFLALGCFAGVVVFMIGVSSIIRYAAGHEKRSIWNLLSGICGTILGGLMIGNVYWKIATVMVMTTLVAVWLLIKGINDIQNALALKELNHTLPDQARSGLWLLVMIAGIVTVMLGVASAANPFISIISAGVLVGLSIATAGIQAVAVGWILP